MRLEYAMTGRNPGAGPFCRRGEKVSAAALFGDGMSDSPWNHILPAETSKAKFRSPSVHTLGSRQFGCSDSTDRETVYTSRMREMIALPNDGWST